MTRKEKPVAGTDPILGKKEGPRTREVLFRKGRGDHDQKRSLIDREATLVFQRVAITVIVTLSLYVIGFSYVWVLLAALTVYLAFWAASLKSRKKALADHLNALDMFSVGTYISGFDRIRQSLLKIECFIAESDFVFVSQDGEELGRIPRDAVNRVGVKEGDRVLQHLPFLRMIDLMFHSLTGRKGKMEKPYHLLIDWRSEYEPHQYTVFEFAGPRAAKDAYNAVNILYRHLKSRKTQR